MSLSITIIDYDAGNLRNVQKALKYIGYSSEISRSPEDVENADVLILPGVGAFQDGMKALEELKLDVVLKDCVLEKKKPLLGICLGMHLLAREGYEGGRHHGLAILPMTIQRLDLDKQNLRIPHIGWNNVEYKGGSLLFFNVPQNPDFYFVHSYHAICEDKEMISATCDYGKKFTAVIESGNIFATQFHPEKSQRYGLQVLKNFMSYCEKRGKEIDKG